MAKRVSEALSGGAARASSVDGVTTFRFRVGSEKLVVCSIQGHAYSVSDPFRERTVYPIFDTEWYPLDLVEKGKVKVAKMIASVRKLSEGANKLVNACDFDSEGETIGFNLLRYACMGREEQALRMKFSSLTKPELVEAFRSTRLQMGQELALTGRARHFIDFVWGINLSRFLSQAALSSGRRYSNVSIGRVQGPTLRFLVEREREIRQFVPSPFWRVSCVFEKDGAHIVTAYAKGRLEMRTAAEKIRADCVGREGTVTAVRRNTLEVSPPPPFNLGDLQKDAYRAFGFSPSRTLQIAEKLYLEALISYPRTASQKLPPTIDYGRILKGLAGLAEYSKNTQGLLRGVLRPVQGPKSDRAHPSIHPTGKRPERSLDSSDAKVYDMVVRRFLSAFAPNAKRETESVTVVAGGHEFRLSGGRTIRPGWTTYYRRYWNAKNFEIPPVCEGERLRIVELKIEEMFDERPPRYNQGSLLERMEQENIGTKSTRAEVIATLLERRYVEGESLVATELGFSVVEAMEQYSPSIITAEFTRKIENQLEGVESGAKSVGEVVRDTVRSMSEQLVKLKENEGTVGRGIHAALMTTEEANYDLGPCPICKTGKLKIVKSRKTKKRFVGCTNYAAGCIASAPLPQRGKIRHMERSCRSCSWPRVYLQGGRRPWRFCVNPGCPSKRG